MLKECLYTSSMQNGVKSLLRALEAGFLGLADSQARVIRAGRSANGLGKSAGPLHFYFKENPRICQNEILFWQIRRRE